ncbi:MAG: DUF3298 domain-containing protein, partial [Bacteroidaceae bacterium]|nr:DUF3298 domain-containing protein [Bacteroidaceae bacterium]
ISNEYSWESPSIPQFVRRLNPNGDWSADTICVVNGKAFFLAYDNCMNAVYSEDGVLAADPTLSVLPYDKERNIFHVSIVGKDLLADFADGESRKQMSTLSVSLPEFKMFHHHITADFCERVSYDIAVDFPKRTVADCDAITKWLIGKIEDSENMHGELPPLNAFYIGYAKRSNTGWRYDGDIHNTKRILKFASDVYFATIKGDYGLDENDYPFSLFSILYLKAYVKNNRFVTFQQYTHDYYGGAHGYYTERLISFDPIHKKEIDYKYMFKDNCMEDIIVLLKEEAYKSTNYQEWKPNIDEFVCVKDEDDKPTGLYRLPHPGLSNEGVVFSFQPYEISCFAAGTFHFTIPYERIRPYLTDKARWCLNMN